MPHKSPLACFLREVILLLIVSIFHFLFLLMITFIDENDETITKTCQEQVGGSRRCLKGIDLYREGSMGTKLAWMRDCWSLFVMNLHPVTTTKDLFFVFREAGPVFDVFVLRKKKIQAEEGGSGLFASKLHGMRIGPFKGLMEEL